MTKAERIFNATRFECKRHIEAWGYEENADGSAVGFNGLIYKDNETISMRTVNAITEILGRRRKTLATDIKLNILTEDRATKEAQLLNMVETTLNNSRRSIAEFNQMLKEI